MLSKHSRTHQESFGSLKWSLWTDTHMSNMFSRDSLCFNNEVVCFIPVRQQVSGVFIVDAYVVITECAWKEVVYLPGNVEDIAHPGEER